MLTCFVLRQIEMSLYLFYAVEMPVQKKQGERYRIPLIYTLPNGRVRSQSQSQVRSQVTPVGVASCLTMFLVKISIMKGEGHVFYTKSSTLMLYIIWIMSLLKLVLPVCRSFYGFTELIGQNNMLVSYRSADHMFIIQIIAGFALR